MKWLAAATIVLCLGSSSAEVLTEANIPKFDSAAMCAAWASRDTADELPDQRERARQFEMGNCLNSIEKDARERVLGRDIPETLIRFCDADARLHTFIGPYATFASCIADEAARHNLRVAEEWITGRTNVYCSKRSDLWQAEADGYKVELACLRAEEQTHMRLKADFRPLDKPSFDQCFADLKARGRTGASWQLLEACVSHS